MEKLWMKHNEELYSLLESDPRGLTTGEAKTRLEKYGENKLQEGKQKTVLQVFAEQFADLLVVILIIAAIISALTGGVEGTIVNVGRLASQGMRQTDKTILNIMTGK